MYLRFAHACFKPALALAMMFFLSDCGTATAQLPKHPDIVFLLIGEVNMTGQAEAEKEMGDLEPIEGTLLLNGRGEWEPAMHPLNRYSNIKKPGVRQQIGPGASFSKRIRESYPDVTVGLIVNARINTKIELWHDNGPIYRKTINRVRELTNAPLAGIIWQHGESNQFDELYLEKLIELIARFRQDFGQPKLPFVAGEIHGHRPPVNGYIRRLPTHAKYVSYAESRELPTVDGTRLSRAGQEELGRVLAESWLGVAAPEFRPGYKQDSE